MIHALKCQKFDFKDLKNVQIEYKKNDKGRHRYLSDHFEVDFLL